MNVTRGTTARSVSLSWGARETEIHDIVQEAVIKTIPRKKKCKKAKELSEEALQIAEKKERPKAMEKRKYIPI